MSSILRFLPFLFFIFLFASSAALAIGVASANTNANADASLSNTKNKLLNMIKNQGNNNIKIASNEDPTLAPDFTTASPLEVADGDTSTTAYVRLVLTVKKARAEKLSSPNAQGNLRKKIRLIVASAIGRPAEGLNITMTIENFEGTDLNKANPKVLLIILVGIPSVSTSDTTVALRAATASDQKSAFYSQLVDETGADSITVQTSYGFPPSAASDGNPFTASDGSLFEAYKTLILAVSISIIGIVFIGAIILFLTKTKERRERLLELFRIGGRGRRQQNQSISTIDTRRIKSKRTSSRYSGRNNSGRNKDSGRNNNNNTTNNTTTTTTTTSGRGSTISTVTAPLVQGSVSVPNTSVPAAINQV